MVIASSGYFRDMLLHGQLIVQIKAEIADDIGRLYSNDPTGNEQSRLFSLARFACNPNQIASVLLAFSSRRRDLHQVLTLSVQHDRHVHRK